MTDASGDLKPIGVKLVTENYQNYISNLGNATRQTQAAGQAIRGAAGGMEATAGAANVLVSGFSMAGGAAMALANFAGSMLTQAFNTVVGAITRATQALIGFGQQAIMVAGRVEQLTLVAHMMGLQQGFSADAIDKIIVGIRKQGIEAGIATQLIIDLVRAEIDLSKAAELARVAQDAAVIAGTNSSDTLERIKYGIMTLQPEVLRTAGIIVSVDKAMKDYAASTGIVVSAMTGQQRQQAMLNAVLAEGVKIQGAYEISMKSGYKIMQSMERVFNDILVAVGAPFAEAFYNIMKVVYETAKAISALVSEGGALYPILSYIGAAAAVVTGYFKDFWLGSEDLSNAIQKANNALSYFGITITNTAVPALTGVKTAITDFLKWVGDLATQFFDFGVNLITQFAIGMMEGAAVALTTAMNFIADMLNSIFGPGSPPKVAKEIDKWGMHAMEEFLKGFTKADFGILKGVGQLLQSAIQDLVSMDFLKDKQGAKLFDKIYREMIKAIDTGSGYQKILKEITTKFGPMGESIAKTVKMFLDLGAAQNAAAKAQERLMAAQEKYSSAAEKMNSSMDEYNQLAASGASPEVLAAKRAEFYAARDNRDMAYKQATAASKELELAQKKEESIKKQLELQQDMVDVLSQLAKNQERINRAGAGGGKAAAGVGGVTMPKVGGAPKVSFDFEELKKQIKTKLEEAMKPITDKFDELFGKNSEFAKSFTRISDAIGPLMTGLDPLMKMLNAELPGVSKNLGQIAGFAAGLTAVATAVGLVAAGLLILSMAAVSARNFNKIMDWLKDPASWDGFRVVGTGIAKALSDAGTAISQGVTIIGYYISLLAVWIMGIPDWFTETGQKIGDAVGTWWGVSVQPKMNKFIGDLITFWTNTVPAFYSTALTQANEWSIAVVKILVLFTGSIATEIKKWIDVIVTDGKKFINKIVEVFKDPFGTVSEFVGTLKTMGENIVSGIIDGILGMKTKMGEALGEVIKSALDYLRRLLDIGSPSQLMADEFGKPIVQGLAQGIAKNAGLVTDSMNSMRAAMNGEWQSYAADAFTARIMSSAPQINAAGDNTNYNLTLQSAQSAATVQQGFDTLRLMQY